MSQQSDKKASSENDVLSPLAKRFLWVDSATAVQKVITGLGVLCAVLFLLDLVAHRHAYAPGEGLPGFYVVVGFVAFTLIVLGAAGLRKLILRNENYYAPFSVDSEAYPPSGLHTIEHGSKDADGGITVKLDSGKASPLADASDAP